MPGCLEPHRGLSCPSTRPTSLVHAQGSILPPPEDETTPPETGRVNVARQAALRVTPGRGFALDAENEAPGQVTLAHALGSSRSYPEGASLGTWTGRVRLARVALAVCPLSQLHTGGLMGKRRHPEGNALKD